jgi:glycosyltransferase involved in cell wall biosynthesis
MAFRHAKETNEAVLGLTTSTLLPVAAARLLANARHIPFAQIVMYGNVFHESNLRLRRWIEAMMLISLLRSDAIVFPNTDHTRKSFLRQIRDKRMHNRISTLYDPIYIPNVSASASKTGGEEILLIPGLDDYRRTPLFHLQQANLVDPPRNVWIHAPGRESEDILEVARFRFTYDLKISTDYKRGDQFAELFVSATWCLLANRPDLGHASGLLAQSIVAGTPVLCSRFPYSKEIFEKFGRLGELFDFDDIDDFNSAWSKLRNWGSAQWQEFETASENFAALVNAERITGQIVNYFTDSFSRNPARTDASMSW